MPDPGRSNGKPKRKVAISRGESANVAVARVCGRLLAIAEHELPGARSGVGDDALHDLRVAIRRTRSIQRQLRGVFPAETLPAFRGELRRIQRVTGPARDFDVMLSELGARRAALDSSLRDGLDAVSAVVDRRRRFERGRMSLALGAKRTTGALAGWRALLDELERGAAIGPDAFHPIDELAGRRIDKLYRRFRRAGKEIGEDSPAEALHDLRKQGKELRYLLEFFGELHSAEVTAPMISALKGLQDVLGRHQDRAAQAELLRSLRSDVRALPDEAAASKALDALMAALAEEQAAARAQFAEHFEPFVAKRQRALVRETFG